MRRFWLSTALLLLATPPALAAEPKSVVLHVEGMTCSLCPVTVRKALERVPGVVEARVDLKAKEAQAKYDPAKAAPEQLARAVSDSGFPAKVKQP
jgi:periplasmic mercuric ion binding protein